MPLTTHPEVWKIPHLYSYSSCSLSFTIEKDKTYQHETSTSALNSITLHLLRVPRSLYFHFLLHYSPAFKSVPKSPASKNLSRFQVLLHLLLYFSAQTHLPFTRRRLHWAISTFLFPFSLYQTSGCLHAHCFIVMTSAKVGPTFYLSVSTYMEAFFFGLLDHHTLLVFNVFLWSKIPSLFYLSSH